MDGPNYGLALAVLDLQIIILLIICTRSICEQSRRWSLHGGTPTDLSWANNPLSWNTNDPTHLDIS